MTQMSFEIFDWTGLRPGNEVEVLDYGLVIAQGVIEELTSDRGSLRLRLSYGGNERTYRREDGWEVRTICRESSAQP